MTTQLHRRTLFAGAITGGGLLSAVAFFLPWIVVSCDGAPLGAFSPFDRATGLEVAAMEVEAGGGVRPIGPPEQFGPEPRYYGLLLASGLIVALGGIVAVATTIPVRPFGGAAMVAGVAATAAVAILGLQERLGFGAAGVAESLLRADPAWGLWLALAGNAVAAAGGLVTLVMGAGPPARSG